MASGRSASCCADWITVVLDVLQVTGQVLLDVLALDFKAALRIVDRQNPEAIDAAAVHSKPSQAVTPPPPPLSVSPRGSGASGTVEAAHKRC